jgi:hypothetical protein
MSEASNNRRNLLVDILVRHQRLKDGGCSCGWDVWGRSWAAHVANAYEDVLQQVDGAEGGLCWVRINDSDEPYAHMCDLLAGHAGPHSCRYCGKETQADQHLQTADEEEVQ